MSVPVLPDAYGLPRIVVDGSGAGGVAELEIGGHVGSGGYAVVREGRQHAVGRHVAVKTLHNFDDDPEAVDALVREARVLGALDHPNIVPVHVLGMDIDGAPLVVMPLIRGVSWTELIDRHDHPFWDQHTGEKRASRHRMDRLSSHLGILMKVANACQHAHERGILHCDVKPDNVMVGEYGQVFLIDWGLAMRAAPHGPADLPWGKDIDSPAGSPNYMAPEMAACEELTIESDVYLLGGCLHEILTGDVPHPGSTMVEAISKIRQVSDHAYDALVPRRLVEAARGALKYDQKQRFASAREFRQAVVDYLESNFGDAWLERAHGRLSDLGAAVEVSTRVAPDLSESYESVKYTHDREEAPDPDEPSVEEPAAWQVHELYAETRYGLQQAREHGADEDLVQQAQAECIELMATYSLNRGDLARAEQLIAELGGARKRPALAKRLHSQQRRKERKSSLKLTALKPDGTVPPPPETYRARGALTTALVTLLGLILVGVMEPGFGFAGLALPTGLALPLLLGLTQGEVGKLAPLDASRLRRRAGWHAMPYVATLALAAAAPTAMFSDTAAIAMLGMLFVIHGAVAAAAGARRSALLVAALSAAGAGVAVSVSAAPALAAIPMFATTTLGAAWVDRTTEAAPTV